MGFFSKVIDTMRLHGGDDDYEPYDDDEDYSEDEYDEEEPQPKKSFFGKVSPSRDGYEEEEEEERPRPSLFPRNREKPQKERGVNVTMICPRSMADAKMICECILQGMGVIINMEGLQTSIGQRIMDFTIGVIYSNDGNLRKVTEMVYMATPNNFNLSGDFQDILSGISPEDDETSQAR